MKDCRDCEFFEGYDYSDGTPHCSYEDNGNKGYEYCPYNDTTNIKNKGIKIEIDTGFMHDYILYTLKNTIENTTYSIASLEVKNIVKDNIKQRVIEEIEIQIHKVVEKEIEIFMQNEITIGGGWSEPERKLTRQQYLAETIEKELSCKFKSNTLKSYAEEEVGKAIRNFERKLKDEINSSIKDCFNDVTRQTLTDNVVQMLMCNDTYKRLSDSMNNFLPQNTSK